MYRYMHSPSDSRSRSRPTTRSPDWLSSASCWSYSDASLESGSSSSLLKGHTKPNALASPRTSGLSLSFRQSAKSSSKCVRLKKVSPPKKLMWWFGVVDKRWFFLFVVAMIFFVWCGVVSVSKRAHGCFQINIINFTAESSRNESARTGLEIQRQRL